jgi:hypothetical protein
LPCKWLAWVTIVAHHKQQPVARDHLVLLDWTCREFEVVLWVGRNLIAEVLLGIDALWFNKQDVGYVLVAPLEVGDCAELLRELRIDEVIAFIYEVNTIRIADGVWVVGSDNRQ